MSVGAQLDLGRPGPVLGVGVEGDGVVPVLLVVGCAGPGPDGLGRCVAGRGCPGVSVLAIVGGGMLGAYLFDAPRGSLASNDLEHQVSLGLFVVVRFFSNM